MTVAAQPPTDVTIRPASRADLLEIYRIERSSFSQPWPYSAFEQFLSDPGFLVADRTSVVGYVVADVVDADPRSIGHVKDIAVHPRHRGNGIGTRLLERALRVLRAEGAARAKLEVRESNEAAIELYEQFGFVAHHAVPEYYEDGEDAVVFVLDLSNR